MSTATRIRDQRFNVTKLEAGSVVHAQAESGLTSYRVLYCNGRAVSMMVGTTERVTCKACIAAGATGGMGARA